MFSGLTSQVSTWMGKKPEDGELPPDGQPPEAEPAALASDPSAAPASPTKGTSKLEMLAGVKSSVVGSMSGVGGWLSGGIPSIPGLNRGGESADPNLAASEQSAGGLEQTTRDPAASATDNVKDDDASSATGGADSGPASLAGTPTDEQQQAFGAVSTKALAGAKSFGGYLYSAVNKAGKSVAEAGAKIKKTVEENRLISELNKEQEAFIAGKPGERGQAVAPWVGAPNEDALREECLALSTDRRNFVRAPPPGVDFAWDFDAIQPVAQATLAADPNLETMRFELVPKVISEENFWRNYFYRVSLLRQSHELNAMANQQSTESNFTSSDSVDQPQAKGQSEAGRARNGSSALDKDGTRPTDPQVHELKEAVKRVAFKEEDWERELEAELKDYEVVPGQPGKTKDEWDEGQIDEMLKDLK